MEARAVLRYARISPRKVKIVLDLIRNKPANVAMGILNNTPKAASEYLTKLLASAIANAENNHQLDVDQLVVKTAEVGKSIVMRRFHARGRGRSARVEKFFSHLKIVVAERAPEPEAASTEQKAA